ncbi:MAG TPA: cytochrome b/b6 domain-containing protein [Allosphingosinicella sp.]|nr:cytochrome b/b6 domain-containing protein [Allosphingosinicella sp.]
MTPDAPEEEVEVEETAPSEPRGGDIVYRHRRSTRIWHWLNALTVFVMLMSGMMIFNAHPRLYWGEYGANADHAWLALESSRAAPAFPGWMTIPTSYNLAGARSWHFLFAWLLVVPGLLYGLWSFLNRHIQRDLAPRREELAPRHIWRDVRDHARLRFPTGEAARRYNILQKASYLGILFLLLPLVVLTGLTMSPGLDAAWPWLLDLFGGRQSARSIHFIAAALIAAFILVHLVMVVLAGPINEIGSMITGRYRLPKEKP